MKNNKIKLGITVYHKNVCNGNEPMKIVGIREDEVELEGDYSGGTNNVCQVGWENIEGVVFNKESDNAILIAVSNFGKFFNTEKAIIKTLFKFFNINDIIDTFRLFLITLVLPISLSIMNILFVGIIGLETKFTFLHNFKILWIDYYFSGHIAGAESWRIQLGFLFLCFIFVKTESK